MPEEIDFPRYLQAKLNDRGWTKAELARKADLAASMITRWLDGSTLPTIPAARRLADVLDTTVVDILVASGQLTPEEGRQEAVRVDPAELSNRVLVAEIRRRLEQLAPTKSDVDANPERYAAPRGPKRRKA
jgi:transcriptional regulator with XRE-family HTH domain